MIRDFKNDFVVFFGILAFEKCQNILGFPSINIIMEKTRYLQTVLFLFFSHQLKGGREIISLKYII